MQTSYNLTVHLQIAFHGKYLRGSFLQSHLTWQEKEQQTMIYSSDYRSVAILHYSAAFDGLNVFPLQDMGTQHHSQTAGRPSALFTPWSASPSPFYSSLLWCNGSWYLAHGGRSRTSTHTGACPSHWWPLFMPLCSPCWPSLASSLSLLPSSRRWKKTGTSWSPSTSASFRSAPLASETTCPERLPIRSSGSSTKWASLVSVAFESVSS